MTLAPALPTIVCAKALPVRLIAAGAGAVCRAERFDLLPGGQGVAHARQDMVAAAARQLLHDVAGVVDIVGVVAAKPLHDVGAAAAVDDVGAGVADDRLREGVAGEVDRAGAGAVCRAERFDLLPGGQGVAHARQDMVAAAARQLLHDVAGVVDIVGVVAAKPLHDVGAAAAVDDVGAGVADDRLREGVAGEVDRAGAGAVCRAERFDLLPGGQGVAHARQDMVAAAARQLLHDVAGVVDIVGVVAAKPLHDVGAAAAVDDVGAGVANEHISEAAAEQILDIHKRIALGIAAASRSGGQVDGNASV